MNAAEKALAITALHDEWVKTAKYTSIPVEGPSQYPETEEDVHTDPESDAEFMNAMLAILADNGDETEAVPETPSV